MSEPVKPVGWHRAQGCSRAIFILVLIAVILSMALMSISRSY